MNGAGSFDLSQQEFRNKKSAEEKEKTYAGSAACVERIEDGFRYRCSLRGREQVELNHHGDSEKSEQIQLRPIVASGFYSFYSSGLLSRNDAGHAEFLLETGNLNGWSHETREEVKSCSN